MAIGRARKFAQKVQETFENLQQQVGKKIDKIKIDELLSVHADAFFLELTKLFNYAFQYRNEDYVEVDSEWLQDNVSIRELKDIGKAIAEQNQLGGLLPLLGNQFRQNLGKALRN